MGAEPLPAFALRTAPEVARLRAVHQEMVDAALAGGGVERLAELAAVHVGRPVALVVPDRAAAVLGLPAGANVSAEVLATIERYESSGQRWTPLPFPRRWSRPSTSLPAGM